MQEETKKTNNTTGSSGDPNTHFGNGYNVLMIMADELRFPIHKDAGGMIKDLKNIIGFQNVDADSNAPVSISEEAKKLFPGFMGLRENAVLLRNHTVATTACVPSRASIFTGQYGTRNGVTQTDGVFKDAGEIGWLNRDSLPTIGDWFVANQYSTHYFGKCHFAHPPVPSLEDVGFENWESSYPEPHGSKMNNLGMYRDPGFTDLVTTFLRRKGMALDYDQKVGLIDQDESIEDKDTAIDNIKIKPWFAVVSFTNPHDITTWPVLPAQAAALTKAETAELSNEPLGIPDQGKRSAPPEQGTWTFDMNPGGIDNTFSTIPATMNEDLLEKPDCQYDYSVKLGIALASKSGSQVQADESGKLIGLPLALASDPSTWSEAYMDYYTYLHYVLDQQIDKVLKTLDETGMRDNTIVLFVPDHGEYGASHGMMQQKWHTAYQEAIHVPLVVSMPNEQNTVNDVPRQITELTSHIDVAPTLLGLVGVEPDKLPILEQRIKEKTSKEPIGFVGADLSDLITDNADTISDQYNLNGSATRDTILFTTSDMITEPVDPSNTDQTDENYQHFDIFKNAVQKNITHGIDRLQEGPVVQPAEVHCVRQRNDDGDWKLVRYRDYYDPENASKYQWELYNLDTDPIESLNLLAYKENPFQANPSAVGNAMNKYSADDIVNIATHLDQNLNQLIDNML